MRPDAAAIVAGARARPPVRPPLLRGGTRGIPPPATGSHALLLHRVYVL